MKPSRRLVPYLALALLTAAARGAPLPTKRAAILVTQPAEACWQDFALLAAVPAVRTFSHGDGAVIALGESGEIPREVGDYLRRLKPDEVCHLGAKPLPETPRFGKTDEIPCSSADEAAVALAELFWKTSKRVVLCRENDYASALMASTLAARLRVPMFVCGDGGPSPRTAATIRRLEAKERLFIGKAPAGLPVTELPDIRSVLAWLEKQGLKTPYLAVVNVRDRAATTVRKLSQAAPILAAAHDGMVVPINADIQWRKTFTGRPIKGALPKGIPAGAKPPKAGVIDLPEGRVPFVLSLGAAGRDHLLFLDLNGDGAFDGPDEGPLRRDGVVTLLGRPRTLDFCRRFAAKFDVSVTTGSADGNRRPASQALRGNRHPALPLPRRVSRRDPAGDPYRRDDSADMTSDLPYGNADDDLFSEIAVGRIIGENVTFATLHASRTVTYDVLLDPSWSTRAGQARWENTMGRHFENVGLDATAYHDANDLAWVRAAIRRQPGQARQILQPGFAPDPLRVHHSYGPFMVEGAREHLRHGLPAPCWPLPSSSRAAA